jgi:hypothetical protein
MIKCLAYFEQAGEIMTILRSIAFAAISITVLTGLAAAQRPTRRPTPRPTPVKTRVSTIPPLEVRAARVKVSNQLSNVDLFVTKLGPIAQSIEDMDRQIMTRKVSKQSIDLNQANKKKVLTAVSTLRTALVALESEFRTKAVLKKYLLQIQGISTLATQSEDLAIEGKFVACRDPLRSVSRKLNDTLAVMPDVEL